VALVGGYRRMNIVQIMYMYVNAKIIVLNLPGIRRGEMNKSGGGGEINYDIFDTL
jgi:hypothetical protein